MKRKLTLEILKAEAKMLAGIESAQAIADEILSNPSRVGYLTISNALQWRLQYGRVIEKAGLVTGIERLR